MQASNRASERKEVTRLIGILSKRLSRRKAMLDRVSIEENVATRPPHIEADVIDPIKKEISEITQQIEELKARRETLPRYS